MVDPINLPNGITTERYEQTMRRAIAAGRARGPVPADATPICADISAATEDLLIQRTSAQVARTELDGAYFDQVNANSVAASEGAPVSQWQALAMSMMISKRNEMTARIEDQNVALYALAQAGLAFCAKN